MDLTKLVGYKYLSRCLRDIDAVKVIAGQPDICSGFLTICRKSGDKLAGQDALQVKHPRGEGVAPREFLLHRVPSNI